VGTDIPNVLMDNYKISESENDSELAIKNRLNELHVKACSARQQQYAEKQRRILHQHKTGTVSRYTLTDTLKEKSEHL
jgi:hypothetical protein